MSDGTGWVGIGAAKARLLLATLLVRANQVVSTEALVDQLWGETPPKTATTQVHGCVLRPRRPLDDRDGDVTTTVAPGYRLVLAEEDTDLQRFERLADLGHAAHRDDPERVDRERAHTTATALTSAPWS